MILALLLAVTMAPRDEFFIISSVDVPHNRLVLKRPTETTVVATITAWTQFRGEHGEILHVNQLRSGDTGYAVMDGLTVVSMRRGGMTVEELHRRFFSP